MKTIENTLVIIKNDTIKRGLVGQIIQKFENAGLKIIAMRMEKPTKKVAREHYQQEKGWKERVGKKALAIFKNDADIIKCFGTNSVLEIGQMIFDWSVDQLIGKEVIVMALQGPNAINKVVAITGPSDPSNADLSTIRGTYSCDTYLHSNSEKRAIYNVIHRSDNADEAKRELKVWFKNVK